MNLQTTFEAVDVCAPAGKPAERDLDAADQQLVKGTRRRILRDRPVNTVADERGLRLVVPGLIDVLVFEDAGVAHVNISAAGPLDDDYPLFVRDDGRIVVNRV